MDSFLIKMRLIYLQFLLVAIGLISIYSFVIWLVMYRFALLALNEELVTLWLPMGLSAISVYIWIWPRIKLLVLKDKRGNLPFFYCFVAWAGIMAPTIITQNYLITATGTLTSIKSIDDINKKPITKYYHLDNHYIDKQHLVVHPRAEVSGRNNERLTYYLYVACPILAKAPPVYVVGRAPSGMPSAWLGIEYSKGLSNNSSDAEKEAAYKELETEANDKFTTQNLDGFIYLDHIGNNSHHKGYMDAIKTLPQYANIQPIILEAKNEPFENRNGDKLQWVFNSFGIAAAIWFIMLLFPKLNKSQLKKLPEYSLKLQWQLFYKFISSLRINSQTHVFIILIAVNILVFMVMVFVGLGFISFDGHDLYNWGADYRPAVIDGEWWRLLTNVFLHSGLMHLLFNMLGLFFVSIILEPIIGKIKFFSAYIVCGLFASLASIWWHPATVSVGASGAIFGLYGILTALLTTNRVNTVAKKALLISNAVFIGINLLVGITGGIDNAAHIGGLISGIIIGYILYFFIDAPKLKRVYKKRVKVVKPETELLDKQTINPQ